MEDGPGAAAVPACARGGDDEMPDLINIIDGLPKTGPHMPSLNQLRGIIQQYKGNNTDPTLKSQIKSQLLTGATLDIIFLVLNDLFGKSTNLRDGKLIRECVLVFQSISDALMDDLPLHTYIKMLFQICIKSYYNDSAVRLALGAAFVGSDLYITWVGAINPILGLGGQVAGYVFTVCDTILNFATDPVQLQGLLETFFDQQPAMGYAENIVSQAAVFFDFLKVQSTSASNLLLICALTNIWFMEKIFPAENFRPLDELRQAAAPPVPPVQPVEPVQPAPPVPEPRYGPEPPPGQPALFTQMIGPLLEAGSIAGNGVKQYLMTTVNRIRKISYVMPGVVGPREHTIQAQCLTFMLSISDYIVTHADDQAVASGRDPSVIKATIALRSMFNTKQLLTQTPTQVAGVIYTLAFSIRNRVIKNLTRDARTRDAAARLLEDMCPVFRSRLTKEDLEQHNLSLCVAGRLQWLLDNTIPSEEFNSLSVAVGSLSQSEDDRDRAADEILRNLYASGERIHFTDIEKSTFGARGINFSLFTSVQKVFSIGIQSIVNCANKLGVIPFTQGIGTQLVDLLTPPVKPLLLINAALPIASVLTNPFFPQITEISDIILVGITKRKTPAEIHDEIMARFKATTKEEIEKVREFIKHLLFLCDLQAKFRFHEMNTASGFIVSSDGRPCLASVLNRETTPFDDNFIIKFTKLVEPEASVSASVSASGSASDSASASEAVVSGVFVQLQQEIEPMVCGQAATSSASEEQKKTAEQAIIDCGVELTQFIGPKLSRPDEPSAAVDITEESVKEVKEVNKVLHTMLSKLDQNVDVGGMVLAAAILNQEENERLNQEQIKRFGNGDAAPAPAPAAAAAAAVDMGQISSSELNVPAPAPDTAPPAPPALALSPFPFAPSVSAAASQGETMSKKQRLEDNPTLTPRSEVPGPGAGAYDPSILDRGGKSRRKSRKNVKKTTRRNKKIVRKSSKNTKQRRSSLRRRSSRKSRK